jgi:hypothetical protein
MYFLWIPMIPSNGCLKVYKFALCLRVFLSSDFVMGDLGLMRYLFIERFLAKHVSAAGF